MTCSNVQAQGVQSPQNSQYLRGFLAGAAITGGVIVGAVAINSYIFSGIVPITPSVPVEGNASELASKMTAKIFNNKALQGLVGIGALERITSNIESVASKIKVKDLPFYGMLGGAVLAGVGGFIRDVSRMSRTIPMCMVGGMFLGGAIKGGYLG